MNSTLDECFHYYECAPGNTKGVVQQRECLVARDECSGDETRYCQKKGDTVLEVALTLYLFEHCENLPSAETSILVIGGFNHAERYLSDVEIVSLDGNEVCRKPMLFPREFKGMVGYINEEENKAVVCGGHNSDTCFEYSFEKDEWEVAGFRMKEERVNAASAVLNNGSFFVLGGFSSFETSEFPVEGKYGPRLPYEAWHHCLCQIHKTHLFMAGGYWGPTEKLAYLLDVETGEWNELPNMIEKRDYHICHPIKGGNEVLVVGGFSTSSVESFSFKSMSWRRVRQLPKIIYDAGNAVEYKETFFIVGGNNPDYSNTVYEFVPSDYTWIERSEKLKKRRNDHLSLPLKSGWEKHAKVCE